MVGSEWSEAFLGGLGDDVGEAFGPRRRETALAATDARLGKQIDERCR